MCHNKIDKFITYQKRELAISLKILQKDYIDKATKQKTVCYRAKRKNDKDLSGRERRRRILIVPLTNTVKSDKKGYKERNGSHHDTVAFISNNLIRGESSSFFNVIYYLFIYLFLLGSVSKICLILLFHWLNITSSRL